MLKTSRGTIEFEGKTSTLMTDLSILVRYTFLFLKILRGEEQALKDMTEIFKKGLEKIPALDNEIEREIYKGMEKENGD